MPAQTTDPIAPRSGPPIPTSASIHALRGASLSAINAPMKGMNTGAPTFRPSLRAARRWPHSCTKISNTNPMANFQPHASAYIQTHTTIDPLVFRNGNRNLSLNTYLKNTTMATPTGPNSFFSFCPKDGGGDPARDGAITGGGLSTCGISFSSM